MVQKIRQSCKKFKNRPEILQNCKKRNGIFVKIEIEIIPVIEYNDN